MSWKESYWRGIEHKISTFVLESDIFSCSEDVQEGVWRCIGPLKYNNVDRIIFEIESRSGKARIDLKVCVASKLGKSSLRTIPILG